MSFLKERTVIGVWVFTAYDDGKVDVTQTTPDPSKFEAVRKAVLYIGRWCGKTVKDQAKCPYSPDNPRVLRHDDINGSDEMG